MSGFLAVVIVAVEVFEVYFLFLAIFAVVVVLKPFKEYTADAIVFIFVVDSDQLFIVTGSFGF